MAADFLSLLTGGANAALSRAVGPVTFKSQLHAPITVDPFASDGAPAPSASRFSVMHLLKPEVSVQTPTGELVFAPYGHPSANYGPYICAGLGLVVISLVGIGGLAGRFMSGKHVALAGGAGLAALAWVASHGRLEEPDEHTDAAAADAR